MWLIRSFCKLIGWLAVLILGILEIVKCIKVVRWIGSILSITFRCGILCALILYAFFRTLPQQAYFEYEGEIASIYLRNDELVFDNIMTGLTLLRTGTIKVPQDTGMYIETATWHEHATLIYNLHHSDSSGPYGSEKVGGRHLIIRPLGEIHIDPGIKSGTRTRNFITGDYLAIYDLYYHDTTYFLDVLLPRSMRAWSNLGVEKDYPHLPLSFSNHYRSIRDFERESIHNRSNLRIYTPGSISIFSSSWYYLDDDIRRRYSVDIAINSFIHIRGQFKIFDGYTNELIYVTGNKGSSGVRLYNYSLVIHEPYYLNIRMYREASIEGLHHFPVDSFSALNTNSGSVNFSQSTNIRSFAINNMPIHAKKYSEPLIGRLTLEDGIFNVSIFGVVREAWVHNLSLHLSIWQMVTDNSLVVASTILSSFIGLLVINIGKSNRQPSRKYTNVGDKITEAGHNDNEE